MLALIFIIVIGEWLIPGDSKQEQISRKNLEFFRSYRYQTKPDSTLSDYIEYEVLLKTIYRIYFDFTSLGVNHFSMDWIDYLENLISKRNCLEIFLTLADRMARNMAFSPGLYEIDIHSGKAMDFPEDKQHK